MSPAAPSVSPRIRLCHHNRLLSESLAAAINDSGIGVCSLLFDKSTDLQSPDFFESLPTDLLLLDASLSGNLTQTIADAFRQHLPDCRVLLLVSELAIHRMVELTSLVNHGCLFEGIGLGELVSAIRSVVAGHFYCSPQIASALMTQVSQSELAPRTVDRWAELGLTFREREILEMICKEQLANKQIARRLGLSLFTVKNHVHNIIEKLGVRDRHEAMNFAISRNLFGANPTSTARGLAIQLPR